MPKLKFDALAIIAGTMGCELQLKRRNLPVVSSFKRYGGKC